MLDDDEPETLSVAVDGEKVPFFVTPNALTTVIRIGPDTSPLLRPRPFQGRVFPKNMRAVQLLPSHTKPESTVRYLGIEVDDALEISEQTGILRSARSRRAGANGGFQVTAKYALPATTGRR